MKVESKKKMVSLGSATPAFRVRWWGKSGVVAVFLLSATLLSARENPESRDPGRNLLGKLTLKQCLEIGLEKSPDIVRGQWNVSASQAEKDIARGSLWPEVRLVGDYAHYREKRLIPPRREGTIEVMGFAEDLLSGDIVLTMPLYTGGRLRNLVDSAEFTSQAARQSLLWGRSELAFTISSLFYSILGQQEVINSLVFSRKALEQHHKQAEELLAAQKVARVDLLRTEVRLADIEQQLLHERNVLNIQRFSLASLLGLETCEAPLEIEGELVRIDGTRNPIRKAVATFVNRRDYQSLLAKVNAQREVLRAAGAAHLPEVSFRASYGNRLALDGNDTNEVGEVGIHVNLPLFTGGRIHATVRRESSRLKALEESLRKLRLRIRLEVEAATENVESNWARFVVMEKAVVQAKESLRVEREKYGFSKGTVTDVLDAQSALLHSQMNYYRVLAACHRALAQYHLAVGKNNDEYGKESRKEQ